jgi:hypothetical protein
LHFGFFGLMSFGMRCSNSCAQVMAGQ